MQISAWLGRVRNFPVFPNLERQPVLVVGGGEPATQKLRLIVRRLVSLPAWVAAAVAQPSARLVADELAGAARPRCRRVSLVGAELGDRDLLTEGGARLARGRRDRG